MKEAAMFLMENQVSFSYYETNKLIVLDMKGPLMLTKLEEVLIRQQLNVKYMTYGQSITGAIITAKA